jgi:SAM-dependent methyltransferase
MKATNLNAAEYWNTTEAVATCTDIHGLRAGESAAIERCLAGAPGKPRILDLGCGGGRTTAVLQEITSALVGMDISRGMIDAARAAYPGIDFRVGTAEALELEDAGFDMVFVAGNSLDYIPTREGRLRALREVHRVVRPGGHFVVSHHNMASWLFKAPRIGSHLLFRMQNILNGNILKDECFLIENDAEHSAGGILAYHSWPRRFLADLDETGFELLGAYANSPALMRLQQWLGGEWVARFLEISPYYALRKRIR